MINWIVPFEIFTTATTQVSRFLKKNESIVCLSQSNSSKIGISQSAQIKRKNTFKGEQHVKSNFQAQLRHNRRYLRCNLENTNLSHGDTVLYLTEIHKYFEIIWDEN